MSNYIWGIWLQLFFVLLLPSPYLSGKYPEINSFTNGLFHKKKLVQLLESEKIIFSLDTLLTKLLYLKYFPTLMIFDIGWQLYRSWMIKYPIFDQVVFDHAFTHFSWMHYKQRSNMFLWGTVRCCRVCQSLIFFSNIFFYQRNQPIVTYKRTITPPPPSLPI